MRKALQPVYINELSFDALIESTEDYSATAPAYPTEEGFSVSDTIMIDPLELSMTLYVTNTPVTWKRLHGVSRNRVSRVVNELIRIFQSGEPVTVETTDKTYRDMVITNMSITKTTEVGFAREIPITLSQITITRTQTASVPDSYARSGQTMASTGTASTGGNGEGATRSNDSVLKSLYTKLKG